MSAPNKGSRPLKEAIFVQVKTPDDNLIFFDETAKLGRTMPYDRPEATCAMRATPSTVVFSLLKYSNRTREEAAAARLELPRGPLDRTERRAEKLSENLPVGQIAVELEDAVHFVSITRDENGVASLETPEGSEDAQFDLPRGRVRLTLVMHSPRGSKIVAAGFQGHVGKPESKETVLRVVAFALNHLAGLPVFRLVSGIETVNVPASPARFSAARPALKASDQVRRSVPARLWNGDDVPALLAETVLDIQVDLETANPVSGRLLFHIKPAAEHAELFEPYRAVAADAALTMVTRHLGPDEVNDLVFSIALGELGSGDIGRLRSALETIDALDLSPRQWAPYTPTV